MPETDEIKPGEQWRGKVKGLTYRLTVVPGAGMIPPVVKVERLISHPQEAETWQLEWTQ